MDELEFAEQFTPSGPRTINQVLGRALAADRVELDEVRAERQAEEDRQAARENMALANRQMGDPLGNLTRCQMAVAEARGKVRDLEQQLEDARLVLHRAGTEYVDWEKSAAAVTEATARRSNDPDLLAEAKKIHAEMAVERMLSEPRPESRPFARGGVAHRSEFCVYCTAENLSDHESYLLHSDPEYAVPVTSPEQIPQVDRHRVGYREIIR